MEPSSAVMGDHDSGKQEPHFAQHEDGSEIDDIDRNAEIVELEDGLLSDYGADHH